MRDSQLLALHEVTLCAADTINPALAARALDLCIAQCAFNDAVLFTHEDVPTRARIEKIDPLRSREAYSAFMLKELGQYIRTPWVLVAQWDGYVLDASRWSETFYEYDYIGAHWPHRPPGMDIGNGGFSLRSARLLRALAEARFVVMPDTVEDEAIRQQWRPVLEREYGIRFAPREVAAQFSYEAFPGMQPSFGFHAVFNMWRHVDDSEMMAIIRDIDVRTFASRETLYLLIAYCNARKFACVKAMYARYRSLWSAQEIVEALIRAGVGEAHARQYVHMCEAA
ncbi:hypothetical protein F4827_002059 [Paraburkholderia bannensis]|jgi:hypothetical protein|uniref:DUF5672 domain-containing protein n=1 Tax=Paraburkholderia bannensis TaxID=765414 RepID=A0A7W9WQL4_9BURK|nr:MULTISPECIES: DUF5672 family protein [Paraburkholderia]MBB3257394.1 hypothetical protein [Paraburkholderia sp. WP4_3_2]MBB6102210.1 hypothetical protein [Paraburkholderia bannensis]